MLLAVPAGALANVGVNITTGGEAFYEDDNLTVAVFDGDAAVTRKVATFGPSGQECAADPRADTRPVVVDAPASDGVATAAVVAPDPGTYRACGWALDASGAVHSRSEALEQIAAQPAEAIATASSTRLWRGISLTAFTSAYAKRGRLLQAAVVRGTCPAVAPSEGDPAVVLWLSAPGGDLIGAGQRRANGQLRPAMAGVYGVCGWVGELPGDPAPEAIASDRFTIVAGKARPLLGLTADRDISDGTKPVRWSANVIGSFAGRVFLEARKVVHAPSGTTRGSGPWKRVATVRLEGQRARAGGDFGLAGSSYLRVSGRTVLPAAIGRQCGRRSRIAQLRLRFPGTSIARHARSKVVELPGSLGGC